MSRCRTILVILVLAFVSAAEIATHADIYRWDTGEVIPGTEGITPGPGVDLSGMELERAFLNGLDLTGANFEASNLTAVALTAATLTDANFTFADLPGAYLGRAKLTRAKMTGANLTGSLLDQSTLTDADLSGASLTGASIANSTLISAILTDANLTDANLTSANLANANLANANLADTSLWNANLTNAHLANANLADASLRDANLTNANLTDAVITKVDFGLGEGFTKKQLYSTASYQANDLRGISLASNDMGGWDFRGQNLTNAYLDESVLTDADLTGAILKNAYVDYPESINSFLFDSTTTCNQWTQFSGDFDPVAAGLTLVESPPGDFDASDALDLMDVDWLSARSRVPFNPPGISAVPWMIELDDWGVPGWLQRFGALFDLNSDEAIDSDDYRIWVKDLARTWYGDANLDGEFNSSDFVHVFEAGRYEEEPGKKPVFIVNSASWSEGDWNGDGFFDTGDLVLALEDGGYEMGPREPAAVPEPSGVLMLLLSTLAGLRRPRTKAERERSPSFF